MLMPHRLLYSVPALLSQPPAIRAHTSTTSELFYAWRGRFAGSTLAPLSSSCRNQNCLEADRPAGYAAADDFPQVGRVSNLVHI